MTKDNERYKWFVLIILTLVYTFNFIDRQILVILQEPIKAELGLSDTQLGLLTGLAFAALYVILGIPIARLADVGNRKNIVAISLAIWSAMTALSGSVQSFLQLLLTRVGVGIGEAGGSPPAHSMISDYFPPEKRATALAIYSTGIYIGILLGFVVGGIIAKLYGWRIAFYALGIPGILLAVILYFTVREPTKGQQDPGGSITDTPSAKAVLKTLLGMPTFLFLAFACGFHTFVTYGISNFLPSFLQRVHGVDIATAGIMLGLTLGIGGGIGTFLGGYLADRFRKKDLRWYIWLPILASIINFLPSVILFFSNNVTLVIVASFFTSALTAIYMGPVLAITHSLVNAKMRALASAILFFVLNLIGLGFGPLTVGLLSDYLLPEFGNLSLRWAFCITFVSSGISLVLFYLGSKTYLADLKRATALKR